MISCSSGPGKASCVGGNKSPSPNGSPISPTGSAKLPPELCGRPAAGCGSCPISNAAMLSGGTATPSTTICGTNTAPSGTIICVPSGIWMTRSRPTTLMSSRPTPAGRTSWPSAVSGRMLTACMATASVAAASSATAASALFRSAMTWPLVMSLFLKSMMRSYAK